MRADNVPKDLFEGNWLGLLVLLMLMLLMLLGAIAHDVGGWLDSQKPFQCTEWRS